MKPSEITLQDILNESSEDMLFDIQTRNAGIDEILNELENSNDEEYKGILSEIKEGESTKVVTDCSELVKISKYEAAKIINVKPLKQTIPLQSGTNSSQLKSHLYCRMAMGDAEYSPVTSIKVK